MSPTRVLAAVVGLQLVAETALTPYWPLLLRALFDAQELTATGAYLTVCRLAGLAALPLWALAARRWSLPHLLVASLLGCAVFDLALALAPTLLLFTLCSAGVVATGSALVLAYPALVAVVDGEGGDRLHGVLVGVGVFHAASLLATVVGAGVVALPEPRVGLALFAVADLLLAVLVARHVVGRSGGVEAAVDVPGAAVGNAAPVRVPEEGAGGLAGQRARSGVPVRVALGLPVLVVVALAVLADAGTSVPRPFFTELVLAEGGSLGRAAALFLLPSVGALAALLVARRLGCPLALAAGAAAAGLLVQAAGPAALLPAVAGRLLLGVGLGLLAVALDLRLFAVVGTGGPAHALLETARSAALLAAPVLATAVATVDLVLPLLVGAGLLGAVALLAPVPLPSRKDRRVPQLT